MNELSQTSRALDRIVSTIGDLPASPAIVASLMNLTADINVDIEKIGQTISADQALTARLLKLSNSSFYGRAKEVTSLREAVVLLGFKTVRSLAVAASTHSLYHKGEDNYFAARLWEHSLATAICARHTAQITGHSLYEEAFIAGLMHDIGKMVFNQQAADQYGEIISRVEAERLSFIDLEDEILGFNHTDVGMLLLHKWSFPALLSGAVFEHHGPIVEEDIIIPLSVVVNAANYIAKHFAEGFNDYSVEDLLSLPSSRCLKLNEETLQTILDRSRNQFEEEKSLFKN